MGQDAIRIGSFFGLFSFLWKFVNNGLMLYRGKDDRINGAIAGKVPIEDPSPILSVPPPLCSLSLPTCLTFK